MLLVAGVRGLIGSVCPDLPSTHCVGFRESRSLDLVGAIFQSCCHDGLQLFNPSFAGLAHGTGPRCAFRHPTSKLRLLSLDLYFRMQRLRGQGPPRNSPQKVMFNCSNADTSRAGFGQHALTRSTKKRSMSQHISMCNRCCGLFSKLGQDSQKEKQPC